MVESRLVSKEFILDKDELIFSYLLKCISVKEPYKKEDGFNTRALNLLIDIDYNKLNSTYSYVFVPIEKSFLNKDILELFNKEKIIFHIFDLIEIDKAFIDNLSSFKKEGFKFSFKFVLFLLFTKSGPPNKNPAFIETLLKATVCELLAKELFNSKELSDKAFLMGIVYGVYSYLGLDKEEFLESLGITDDIKIAVSEEKGDLGKILKAANFIEKDDIKGFLDTLREIKENIDDDYIIKKIKEIYL